MKARKLQRPLIDRVRTLLHLTRTPIGPLSDVVGKPFVNITFSATRLQPGSEVNTFSLPLDIRSTLIHHLTKERNVFLIPMGTNKKFSKYFEALNEIPFDRETIEAIKLDSGVDIKTLKVIQRPDLRNKVMQLLISPTGKIETTELNDSILLTPISQFEVERSFFNQVSSESTTLFTGLFPGIMNNRRFLYAVGEALVKDHTVLISCGQLTADRENFQTVEQIIQDIAMGSSFTSELLNLGYEIGNAEFLARELLPNGESTIDRTEGDFATHISNCTTPYQNGGIDFTSELIITSLMPKVIKKRSFQDLNNEKVESDTQPTQLIIILKKIEPKLEMHKVDYGEAHLNDNGESIGFTPENFDKAIPYFLDEENQSVGRDDVTKIVQLVEKGETVGIDFYDSEISSGIYIRKKDGYFNIVYGMLDPETAYKIYNPLVQGLLRAKKPIEVSIVDSSNQLDNHLIYITNETNDFENYTLLNIWNFEREEITHAIYPLISTFLRLGKPFKLKFRKEDPPVEDVKNKIIQETELDVEVGFTKAGNNPGVYTVTKSEVTEKSEIDS